MDTKKIIEILDKNIDQQGLAKDIAFQIIVPFIEKFAADTATPYDDMLVDWVKKYIEAQVV
ncbi:MAG: hypothetical protein K2Q18_06070 [Bdellovibrionales bacterium]|nr:hypothetical protein [Bdellovibrionales bacterium]